MDKSTIQAVQAVIGLVAALSFLGAVMFGYQYAAGGNYLVLSEALKRLIFAALLIAVVALIDRRTDAGFIKSIRP